MRMPEATQQGWMKELKKRTVIHYSQDGIQAAVVFLKDWCSGENSVVRLGRGV